MSGNTIGRLFTVTTFGESHGPAMGCIVDGCPPGLPLSEADLQQDVDRRRTGTSHFVSQRREADQVRILSGVFEGHTTGTPIGILIDNTDARSRDYDKIKDRFRPGHADYTYQQKYGVRDYRGGGRSSARETVMRTAAGAIARRYLAARLGVRIYGYLSQVGPLSIQAVDPAFAYQNPFFCPDPSRLAELEELIWKVRAEGDSIGARVTVVASGVPPGLGEPVFDRLDADIAHALMSINAVKAVEIGAGTRPAADRSVNYCATRPASHSWTGGGRARTPRWLPRQRTATQFMPRESVKILPLGRGLDLWIAPDHAYKSVAAQWVPGNRALVQQPI